MKKQTNIILMQELKGNIVSFVFAIVTAILITWAGIEFKQQAIRIVPLYVSLIVGMLQSRASRYVPLVGGINSFIYVIAYLSLGLYAMAGYALLVSAPIQLVTFIRWNKKAYKHTTHFKRLRIKQIVMLAVIFVVCFIILYFVMTAANSNYKLLDISVSLIGIFVSILMLLSFREYSWLMLVSAPLVVLLDVTMIKDNPAQLTYLFYSCYSLTCAIRQFFAVRKLCKEQWAQKGFL